MTQYGIETAKSGRSQCQKCKQKIAKDELRISTSVDRGEMTITNYIHVGCFYPLPKEFRTKDNKLTVGEFVTTVLEDPEHLLDEKETEIIELMESAKSKQDEAKAHSPLALIKAAAEAQKAPKGEPAPKKIKSEITDEQIQAYLHYSNLKSEELKDLLTWNGQIKTGTKDMRVFKCIDGHLRGRLAVCPLDQGQLKMHENMESIVCNGRFDDVRNVRLSCAHSMTLEQAPRWQPWYTEETTEEQKEEMQRLVDDARGDIKPSTAAGDDVATLQAAVADLDWNVGSKAGLRQAANDLLAVLQAHPKPLDLPADDKEARQTVGALISLHRDKSAAELIPFVVDDLGFKDDKERAAVKKEEGASKACKNPANAPIVAALSELSELYFGEGNSNAGIAYKKAVAGICSVEYEITTDNAKALCKGKTKVEGIGKGTADKIHELLSTGKIEKLEEKRAAKG